MLIDVRAIGFRKTDSIQRHVESKVESALGFVSNRVMKVMVRLEDNNGERGGIDKRCGVTVFLQRDRIVIAEAVKEDLYAAVDAAVTRARHAALRRLTRAAQLQRLRIKPRRVAALVD